MDTIKYIYDASLAVHFKIYFIDGIMFGFSLGTSDGIILGLIEITDLVSLIGSYKISRNINLVGLLDGISRRRDCTWKY